MPSGSYIGKYSNDIYGKITVSEKEGALQITFGPKKAELLLEHWNGNTFSVSAPDFPVEAGGFATFQVDPGGKATTVTIDLLNEDGCGFFKRVKEKPGK